MSASIDKRSAATINTLIPPVQPVFIAICLAGKQIAKELGADDYIAISGNRTWQQQDALYAKGRTQPGAKVTNARGGYSNHNFGIAADFGVFRNGVYLDSNSPKLALKVHTAVASWAKEYFPKIEWGGSWKSFPDSPHFQFSVGLSLADMRKRVEAGKSIL